MNPLRLALLISLCTAAPTSAQTASKAAGDFRAVTEGRTVIVIGETGLETKGRVVRVTPDQLTMMVHANEVSFQRDHIAALYERHHSIKKGLIGGSLVGPVLLLTSGGDGYDDYEQAAAVLFTVIGAGVGALIDLATPERRLIYEKAAGSRTPIAVSVIPSLGRARIGVSTGVSW